MLTRGGHVPIIRLGKVTAPESKGQRPRQDQQEEPSEFLAGNPAENARSIGPYEGTVGPEVFFYVY